MLTNEQREQRKQERQAERQAERERVEKFRHNLEVEYNIVGHPKAYQLWQLAWSYGHACGFNEVEIYYRDLVSLIA